MTNREEIERRRTFAIISHPDAGKTTLTEKLLLYGGAINQAGSVKGKQSAMIWLWPTRQSTAIWRFPMSTRPPTAFGWAAGSAASGRP